MLGVVPVFTLFLGTTVPLQLTSTAIVLAAQRGAGGGSGPRLPRPGAAGSMLYQIPPPGRSNPGCGGVGPTICQTRDTEGPAKRAGRGGGGGLARLSGLHTSQLGGRVCYTFWRCRVPVEVAKTDALMVSWR